MTLKKFDTINVVPFIDVILVLLVIVLSTASFIAKGLIPIDLSDSKSSQKLIQKQELSITIKQNGEIFFNKEKISKKNIVTSLAKYKQNTNITISCDKNARFDNFVYLIDILKSKHYTNLSIVTKYE